MQNSILATCTSAAIAVTVTFPTVCPVTLTRNANSDPVTITAMKSDTTRTVFVGFVIGHQPDDLANHPEAQGYNNVIELQKAFKHFILSNKVMIAIGKHSHGVKRLFDSMLGNQVIDLETRLMIEIVDLVGMIEDSYPNIRGIEAYAEEHGLHLPPAKSIISCTQRVALAYVDVLDRQIRAGAAPTWANMMPYKPIAMPDMRVAA